MAQLREDYPEFVRRNTEIIAIGPEDAASFAEWWKQHDMPFVGIADPAHELGDLYGQEVNPVKLGRMPAQFIVDRQGQIRYQHLGNAMWDIHPDQEIQTYLDQINREGQ